MQKPRSEPAALSGVGFADNIGQSNNELSNLGETAYNRSGTHVRIDAELGRYKVTAWGELKLGHEGPHWAESDSELVHILKIIGAPDDETANAVETLRRHHVAILTFARTS